ncbi:hypothetical protein PHYPSEUDO_013605 [Phytophthora pseudosyringae]|uniref:Uncharacterized protein n=1 Tax=Phytophthora pseudosyringae TaxID=221518 RepID=A0A8T1W6M3_9STRA|nr:hypothetical protein PHYPSEUDO_013605 [Phytophthora pseudosyringae]
MTTDSIVVGPEHHDTLQSTPPLVAAALPLPLPSVKKPHKLTPLEKKERDRLRMKEQSQRHKQAIKDQYDQVKRFTQENLSRSTWHQQERLEEELVLRRLERDTVEPQRFHPAAAGFFFNLTTQDPATSSPVLASYSYALRPPSQASRLQLQSRSGLKKTTNIPTEAEYLHPACHGYAMTKHDDSSRISPVFFFSGFAKIPLDKVVMKQDEIDSDGSDVDDQDVGSSMFDAMLELDGGRELSDVAKARQQENKRRLEAVMAARELYPMPLGSADKDRKSPRVPLMCLVCKTTAVTTGCPGCFSFSSKKYLEVETFKATQRPKTPKTVLQEEEDLRARHKALQRQIIIPPLLPRLHLSTPDLETQPNNFREDENNFYSTVLPDFRAVRMHRALSSHFITLHVKSLPVGQLISLTLDLKSSVSYLYELYRANSELPNRPLHLLLPTTHGLFYLDEHIEAATYTRNGVVNGELLLEDFNLQKTTPPSRSDRADAVDDSNKISEFLIFAVAILHPHSTPQLILNYVQQNFHFKPPENRALHVVISMDTNNFSGLPQWTRLVPATLLLPKAVDQDPFQTQIRPHIHAMHVFAKINYAIVAAEQREERERILQLAHQEAKTAKLALKKKLRDQQTPAVSNKVRRALAYFEFVCENTSNPHQPHVAEERLGKLWQFMQMMEEWKILKGGRLLNAERSDVTLSLLQELKDTASLAFNQMMFGAKSLMTDKDGGGTLPYPVLCLEGGGTTTRKLVLRLGTRMGVTQQDDYDYGMVLDLDQDFDALEKEPRMLKRGNTKRAAAGQESKEPQIVQAWADAEWRTKGKGSSTMALLVSSSDLLSPPFHRIKWPLVVKAYNLVLKRVALVSAKLDEFNSLAQVLQSPDAVLSKTQLIKWQSDVDRFLATLHENCALARAVQRVLSKKGVAVLKRRAQARRKQLRDREHELQRLQELQLEGPKLTLAQQLKAAFMQERAPKLREALELTPAEKLGAKAGEILGKAASGVVKAARKAKKEYAVRTL